MKQTKTTTTTRYIKDKYKSVRERERETRAHQNQIKIGAFRFLQIKSHIKIYFICIVKNNKTYRFKCLLKEKKVS